MSQKTLITIDIDHREVSRQKSLGAAINLCATAAGFEAKEVCHAVGGIDKAQYSRWISNQEGIKWEKLVSLMDACGNDAPLLWMLHQCGYDLASLRKTESETERALRTEREARMKVEQENAILRGVLMGKAAA
ncbi:hypothetical protein GCM10009007_03080 [Formosimonas limnophila]|uniref:Uncharacterized protein n=1 Tax=Formosimonas limnophila TaxID=1384487 RepID=A0A8J3CLI5_9BURK|nr:hypothetical protein [Formosimonas limnophila]GHA66022.1 hypothetical protein GCM10009007_03080 [Formosimonas limnophila]